MREPRSAKIAFIDIETSPNLAYVWGKYQQDAIAFDREWIILSFSVKWAHERRTRTYALPDYFKQYKRNPQSDYELVCELWAVFNEADIIVAHNGDKFDCKKSMARFIYHDLHPPAPYKTIDTLKLARKYFAFTSNKLNDLAGNLGLGRKVETGGFQLWLSCMRGDASAWRKMKRYNANDVILLEKVYDRFKSWHSNHPNITLGGGRDNLCPACGSDRVQRRGWEYTKSFRIQRFQCTACSKWSRGNREKVAAKVLA